MERARQRFSVPRRLEAVAHALVTQQTAHARRERLGPRRRAHRDQAEHAVPATARASDRDRIVRGTRTLAHAHFAPPTNADVPTRLA
eukprot:2308367-Pleurochrysis_carterae.AAC.4